MTLRTADQYIAALRDGRALYYRGRHIDDVTAEPELRVAVEHAALDYRLAADPSHHDLAVAKDPDTGEDYSAYYRIPRSTADLLARSKLIETTTAIGGTMVTLIKEIGTDALFACSASLKVKRLSALRRSIDIAARVIWRSL